VQIEVLKVPKLSHYVVAESKVNLLHCAKNARTKM
jgi:hypothetical protein